MQRLIKYLFSILVFVISYPIISTAQKIELPIIDHQIVYSDTIFVNNTPKKQLFNDASKWLLIKFSKQNSTGLLKADTSEGRILAYGQMKYFEQTLKGRSTNIVNYLIEIRVFDNAYGFRFYKFKGYNYELAQQTSIAEATIDFESDYKIYHDTMLNPIVPRRILQLDDNIRKQIKSLKKTLGAGV